MSFQDLLLAFKLDCSECHFNDKKNSSISIQLFKKGRRQNAAKKILYSSVYGGLHQENNS